MGSWIIRWNFDKDSYRPGEAASVSFWLENSGDTPLFLSELKLEFDFGIYDLASTGGMISPRTNGFLGSVRLSLPAKVVGRKIFSVRYHMHEYTHSNWIDLGFYQSERRYFISIYPMPFYRVFISRGLHLEDRIIGDPLVEAIREWGFETITVGVEVVVSEDQVASTVREEIKRADAVIAIATPRFLDALTGLWRVLEWHHDEVGIAFGLDKPLLILRDKRVSLGGLPSYLALAQLAPLVEFDPYNLDELKTKLSSIMPGFREWVETKRRQAFFEGLGKLLAVIAGIVVVSGIVGALTGSSKQ
ncbi:hypothetical protein M1N59_00860 [Dehalococcoidales bacterium]|nr:hypothetical protein [Dehalococcoidales bacterium]